MPMGSPASPARPPQRATISPKSRQPKAMQGLPPASSSTGREASIDSIRVDRYPVVSRLFNPAGPRVATQSSWSETELMQ